MSTLPQNAKTQEAKLGKISFLVPELWKRQIMSAAALRGETIREIGVRALSKHLKVDLPEEMREA